MVNKPVLQIVGYQNSGKTTLMCKVIKKCVEYHLRVGTIKHHGHGGKPYIQNRFKDSDKHRHNGAAITAVEGDGAIEVITNKLEISLEDLLRFYQSLPIDVILVEGYKNEPFPKIVLVKNEQDIHSLKKLKNIQAVISWIELDEILIHSYLVFSIHDEQHYIDWILQYLRDFHE